MLRRVLSSAANTLNATSIQRELLKSYLGKTKHLFLCINNHQLAERVGQVIGDQFLNPEKFVFEASPGNGILTEQLLKNGTPRIRVFEHIESKLEVLKTMQNKYGKRLEIVDKQILGIIDDVIEL